jgi:hypothetical protein
MGEAAAWARIVRVDGVPPEMYPHGALRRAKGQQPVHSHSMRLAGQVALRDSAC